MWSQSAMHFEKRGKTLYTSMDEEIAAFLRHSKETKHSMYVTNLETWEHFLPAGQIHIAFFDHLQQSPYTFLKRVYEFLDVDASSKVIPESANKKRHSRKYPNIPPHFAANLAERYYDQIVQLHQRFANEYTAEWLTYAQQQLHENFAA